MPKQPLVAYRKHFSSSKTRINTGRKGGTEAHLLRDLLKVKGTRAADNDLLVNLHAGERGDLAAGGDDNVLGANNLLTALLELNLDFVGRNKRAETLAVIDLVLAKEVTLNTAGERLDSVVLVLQHLGKVQLDTLNYDVK